MTNEQQLKTAEAAEAEKINGVFWYPFAFVDKEKEWVCGLFVFTHDDNQQF